MGRYLLKPKPDEDFYLMWSTVVDAPVQWGPRSSFVKRAIENDWITEFVRRFAEVDKYGSNEGIRNVALWEPGQTILYAGPSEPVIGMWEVKYADLRALVESYDEEGKPTEASKAFLTPFDEDD